MQITCTSMCSDLFVDGKLFPLVRSDYYITRFTNTKS